VNDGRFSIQELPDAAAVGERAAELFFALGAQAQRARGRFSVALAGGSSPKPMHRSLTERAPPAEFNWSQVDVFFGDERAAPPDSPQSNYGNAREQLLERVAIDPARVHPMRAWETDLEASARAYEQELQQACGPGGALDLLVMGVGEDAHILSLFPGCPLIDDDGGSLVAALRDPPMNPALSRLTLTPTALRRARCTMVLFVGAKKRDAYTALRHAHGAALRSPVALLHGISADSRVFLLVDHAAAALEPSP
jgi:6-phosphogluconolactonase